MTINTHNRALEADAREDTQAGQLCFAGTRIPVRAVVSFAEAAYSPEAIKREYPTLTIEQISAAFEFAKPVVTPPAEEVGRADLAWLEGLKTPGIDHGLFYTAQQNARIDRILSHVSRLEGESEHAERVIVGLNKQLTEQFEVTTSLSRRFLESADHLKLAVEALEKIERNAINACGPSGQGSRAVEAILSCVHEALSSLRPSVCAPGGDVDASRQSGGEG